MRKRSARKWLHFILDLLPVIFIPVFMVYSHRHTIDSYVAEQQEVKVVNFNQIIELKNTSNGGLTQSYIDDVFYYSWTTTNYVDAYISYCDVNSTDKYYVNANIIDYRGLDGLDAFGLRNGYSGTIYDYVNEVGTSSFNQIIVFDSDSTFGLRLLGSANGSITDNFLSIRIMCFNLTQMFGSGNEPSIEQFTTLYPYDYYDYTTGRKEALYTGNTITYNETDILSQLMYSMYNATDKYFNFNKLFNMQSLYNWVQVNFFGGNAPLIIPIVWNIIVYELFMDILFLIYAVFMFIVDFATNMVDSFLHKSSKGGY